MSTRPMITRAAGLYALASFFPVLGLFLLSGDPVRYLISAVPLHLLIIVASIVARARLVRSGGDSARPSRDEAIRRHRRVRLIDSYLAGPSMAFGCGGALLMASGSCALAALASPNALLVLHTLAVAGFAYNEFAKDAMAHLRRCAAGTLQEVLDSGRDPVLYLRSFRDDDAAQLRPNSYQTEEEEVADALEAFGPLIAIGEPGEELPDLGAARGQFDDGDWQDAIRDFMGRSIVVVLRAGATRGLLWEVRQAVELVDPRRVVFLVPRDETVYRAFVDLVGEDLPRGLPRSDEVYARAADSDADHVQASRGSLYGIVYFAADWTPTFSAIEIRPGITVRYLTIALHRALRPVHENLGLEWRRRHTSPFMSGNWMKAGRGSND